MADIPGSTPSSTFEGGGGIRSGCSSFLNAGTRRIAHGTWQLALQSPNCMQTHLQVAVQAHAQAILAQAPRSLLQCGRTLCHLKGSRGTPRSVVRRCLHLHPAGMARTLEVHESMCKPALLSSPRTRCQTCVINMVSTA